MKISIQGNLIDTDNIYRIGDIKKECSNMFSFEIESFNEKTKEIGTTAYPLYQSLLKFLNTQAENSNVPLHSLLTPQKKAELWNKSLEETEKEISEMRENIIKIWSDNQSNIPTFKFKNY